MVGRWYVVSFQSGRGDLAERNLRRQGFRTWMPRQTRIVTHARRKIERCLPFFPGYMFVLLDLERDRWRAVNGTMGVRTLVMQGEKPLPCPVGLIEELQSFCDANGIFNPAFDLKMGDAVRIVSGPFADAIGSLARHDGVGRVRVLLQMMRSEIPVIVDARAVVPAGV